jgi:hypothetical protein
MEVDEALNQLQETTVHQVEPAVALNENAIIQEGSQILQQPIDSIAGIVESGENVDLSAQNEQISQESTRNNVPAVDSLDENLSNQIANLTANEQLPEANSSQVADVTGDILSGVDQDNLNGTVNESMNLDDATCKSANNTKRDDDDLGDLDEVGGGNGDDDLEDMDQNDSLMLKDLDLTTSGTSLSAAAQAAADAGNNVYTFRKTEWDVKKMENYVKLTFGEVIAMEKLDPPTLNNYLKSFFEHAKKSDGMDYEPESLIGFMNSYERYLKTKNYPESLLRSDAFKESRTILKNKRELVRSIGKLIRTKSKDTCFVLQYHRNLLKEKGLLNRDNPDGLLAEVCY